jgi:translation initiation factor 2 subunit 2
LSLSYDELLKRLRDKTKPTDQSRTWRLDLPKVNVLWLGNKTIIRNYMDFPRILRRDPSRFLMYLAKKLAVPASLDGERAILIGRRDERTITAVIEKYVNERVKCPVCGSPDTNITKEKRMEFLVCEACGGKSPIGEK